MFERKYEDGFFAILTIKYRHDFFETLSRFFELFSPLLHVYSYFLLFDLSTPTNSPYLDENLRLFEIKKKNLEILDSQILMIFFGLIPFWQSSKALRILSREVESREFMIDAKSGAWELGSQFLSLKIN